MNRIAWTRKAVKQLLKLRGVRIVSVQEVRKRDERTY
jgi:hypothetical protein